MSVIFRDFLMNIHRYIVLEEVKVMPKLSIVLLLFTKQGHSICPKTFLVYVTMKNAHGTQYSNCGCVVVIRRGRSSENWCIL